MSYHQMSGTERSGISLMERKYIYVTPSVTLCCEHVIRNLECLQSIRQVTKTVGHNKRIGRVQSSQISRTYRRSHGTRAKMEMGMITSLRHRPFRISSNYISGLRENIFNDSIVFIILKRPLVCYFFEVHAPTEDQRTAFMRNQSMDFINSVRTT